jgi:decaprenylphospho-beta-D-erythro-pentofuranosid-2-ulose 2-reductase
VSDALLVGGTSEIGLAIVRRLAAQRVWLLGRDSGRLAQAAAEVDGASVEVALLDADDIASHRHAIERAFADADGFDVVVIAVERPRVSNAIYGAAKAALAEGLSDAIVSSGVRVLVVRPGFVKTRMTANLPPVPFATTPEVVASATVAALGGHARTIWVPGRLRLMFAILRHLPRGVYRRLPL